MGHQLWTSPITGYRRKGTRLSELRSLLGSGITAHAILEPLQSCPADAHAKEMKSILEIRDFDVAGVQRTPDGSVIGFVSTKSLKNGYVKDHIQTLIADHLISDATPLPSLLSVLKHRQHTFVLIGSAVRGIVTRADLNKPPVRVYLFGLISLIEMHLSFWIKARYANDEWKKVLNENRLISAEELLSDYQKRNLQVSLLDCLQFCDKRDLIIAHDKLRDQLNLGTKKKAKKRLSQAEKLRNLLAHSQQDLAQGASWEEAIDIVEWIEEIVLNSDQLVEEEATNSASRHDPGLWASA